MSMRWAGRYLAGGLLLLLMLAARTGYTQSLPFGRDTLAAGPGDTLRGRMVPWVPFSEKVSLNGLVLPDTAYTVDYQAGWIIIRPGLPAGTYILTYTAFRKAPRRELALKVYTPPGAPDPDAYPDLILPDETPAQMPWQAGTGITQSGSLTRGVTVGNNRGLSVTSGLRLQLEGDLGDGIMITGAITDENLPVQPDGNTQQLSDFDRIFIRVQKDPYSVTLGDFEVEQKNTRFANLYRNVQGLQVTRSDGATTVSLSGAVAKGKFHTNSFAGQDGVAGPYRLTGKNGERFFIILAGSEKVYLNGKLLQRGENLDYVINYNTAELTFTARHVITNVSRIVVDFEYNDRYYNRSLTVLRAEHRALDNRLRVAFSYGRDADNPNAPFDDPDAYLAVRDTLAAAGDNPAQAVTSGVFEAGYDEDDLRYARRDTLIAGQAYERYVRSRDPVTAVYAVRFSFVGVGAGYYEPDPGDNENVYRWVPPGIDGQPQGSYAPVRTWVLPRLQQVADLQTSFQVNKYVRLVQETAISSDDKNRLSGLQDGDNQGLATYTGIVVDRARLGDSSYVSAELNHQFVQARYDNLDRLYKAEYGRVWNIPDETVRRDEQVWQSALRLGYRGRWEVSAEHGLRTTGAGRTALRQVYGFSSDRGRLLRGQFTFTRITNEEDSLKRNAYWNRYEGDLYLPVRFVEPGVVIWIEDKAERQGDSLRTGTYSFWDLKPYLRTRSVKQLQSEVGLNYRYDREWLGGSVREKSEAWTAYTRTTYRSRTGLQLSATAAWRELAVLDSAFEQTGLSPARTLTSNLQTTYAPRNRVVFLTALYESGAERIARREVRYLLVNPGQGNFVWLDSLYNRDGVQDLEEFQPATNPLVADFIRVVVPTRELFPATRQGLTGSFRVELAEVFPDSVRGLAGWVRQIRLYTVFRLSQNQARDPAAPGFSPIRLWRPLADTTLLDASYSLRQDISFFQNNPRGDIRFSWVDNQARQFLTTGDELRGNRYLAANQRLTLAADKSLEIETRIGRKFTLAELFPARNADIRFVETEPKVSVQFSRKLRLSGGYVYAWRTNTPAAQDNPDTRLQVHKLVFDGKWNLRDRNNLFARVELARLTQTGTPGFSAAYELQEGFRPGLNGVWQVFATWYVFQNLELSVTYDGRASAGVPVVHTGRVQVRALF
ncbi:MAG: hypothetical protein SF053_02790 [Bacteroidia bacterium]|nr:hypothetical protein [Bacteroidia bacterium]